MTKTSSSLVGGLSIHCVDIAFGRVAEGLAVEVWRLGGPRIAAGRVAAGGLLEHPALMSDAIGPGGHEVLFDVGGYYASMDPAASQLMTRGAGFLQQVPYRFHIAEGAGHTHLPFKFTPWGFSLFRGGA